MVYNLITYLEMLWNLSVQRQPIHYVYNNCRPTNYLDKTEYKDHVT